MTIPNSEDNGYSSEHGYISATPDVNVQMLVNLRKDYRLMVAALQEIANSSTDPKSVTTALNGLYNFAASSVNED